MVKPAVDRLVPSVDFARREYEYHCSWLPWLKPGPLQDRCALNAEAASVWLDVAMAAESDRRRGSTR